MAANDAPELMLVTSTGGDERPPDWFQHLMVNRQLKVVARPTRRGSVNQGATGACEG